jgi:hypothetical protein
VLRRGVRRPAGAADQPGDGRAVDDGAAALGIWPNSCFMHAHTPRKLIAVTRSKISAGSSAAPLGGTIMPALLHAMSSLEGVDGRLHHGSHAVLVGHVTTNTKGPVSGGSQLVGGRIERSSLMSAMTTAAPASANERAVARPMPELPPVTNATRPRSRRSGS